MIAWACAIANVHDTHFHPLITRFEGQTLVLSDHGFHAKAGDPSNLKVCQPLHHNECVIIETVLSMLTTVCYLKKILHRVCAYFQARYAFTMATYNLLVAWHGFQPDATGLCICPSPISAYNQLK